MVTKLPNRTAKKDRSQGNPLRVVELFAGVGGFRLGLSGRNEERTKEFKTVWFNQWEPSTKKQHAHETYVERFGYIDEHTNKDIATVIDKVPDHDLLVGGFPCQDYSVARNLSAAAGLKGKKGVLWWSIHDILVKQGPKKAPMYLMLENVDRLPKSPATQRGRDFAVILSTLNTLGYIVEWRIINAADYGMPQRRRRIFITAYKKGSPIYKRFEKTNDPHDWLKTSGIFQKAFPATIGEVHPFPINPDAVAVSDNFNKDRPNTSPFRKAGISINHAVYTCDVDHRYKGAQINLGDILIDDKDVPPEYYIQNKDLPRWKYLKGAKNEPRKSAGGFEFTYTEGAMSFPDSRDKPSRTIITAEGGSSPSRFKHVIQTKKGLRRLTPLELERLCMFPDNHTVGHGDTRRAFFMGNALVVGVIERIGKQLILTHRSF